MNFARDVVDAADPARPALLAIDGSGERREIAFGELADRSARLAGALAARGVGRGDVVMTLIGNRPEWVYAMTSPGAPAIASARTRTATSGSRAAVTT